jgi:hypothetical protein
MKRLWAVLGVALLCAPVAWADNTEDSIISFGSGATFLSFSVSNHGNVIAFQSPEGAEHIKVGSVYEGYAICSDAADPHGIDFGSYEAGFGAATVTQPKGPNTLPLTITRSTSDGYFSLKQAFARDTTEKSVTVTMTLKNTSGAMMTNVKLARFVDFDIDGTFGDIFTETSQSVDAVDDFGVGVMLLSLTKSFPVLGRVEDFTLGAATTCATGSNVLPPFSGDGAGRLVFFLPDMKDGKSNTVKVEYIRH